ncbi:hypothetical protein [Spirillospora sp. NPDC047279]
MYPQTKKIWPTLATAVLVIFAFNNPEKAAQLCNQAVNAISTFANSLG